MTRIKICGVRTVEHARVAIDAGADLLGFIFYPPARRYLDPAEALALVRELPPGRVEIVGVFVNESLERIVAIADLVGLDRVQLSGDESSELNRLVGRPVVRTVHVGLETTTGDIAARIEGAELIHLDTKRSGSYGGTGEPFDWRIARAASALGPVLLAGGLRPENVAEAITQADPWGVDVSSGVETDGVKDVAKIEAFVRAARLAGKAGTRP